jgi:hypothetical protein
VTAIGTAAFEATSLTSVIIPNSVTSISVRLLVICGSLTNVIIPNSITNIGGSAFYGCGNLKSIYFTGNSPVPTNDLSVFQNDNMATVFYLPGATGWGSLFDGRPTALWVPQIQSNCSGFGVQTNRFGFNLNWASGQTVVVEACTNLVNPDWRPVQTNTFTTGSAYFSDPQWTNYPIRYYRIRSP